MILAMIHHNTTALIRRTHRHWNDPVYCMDLVIWCKITRMVQAKPTAKGAFYDIPPFCHRVEPLERVTLYLTGTGINTQGDLLSAP